MYMAITIEIIFLIIGIVLIGLTFYSLIYQVFSASILAFFGIIFLNLANNWFNWYWLILFAIITIISSLGGLLLTLKVSRNMPENKSWIPIIFGIFGAVLIPIPFIGSVSGVFVGTLFALLFFPRIKFTPEKLKLAAEITFKSSIGLAIEIAFVMLMFGILILLVIF